MIRGFREILIAALITLIVVAVHLSGVPSAAQQGNLYQKGQNERMEKIIRRNPAIGHPLMGGMV